MQKVWDARNQQDMLDREASILRAKTQAALAEGISWGMSEDAMEESTEVSCLFQPQLLYFQIYIRAFDVAILKFKLHTTFLSQLHKLLIMFCILG